MLGNWPLAGHHHSLARTLTIDTTRRCSKTVGCDTQATASEIVQRRSNPIQLRLRDSPPRPYQGTGIGCKLIGDRVAWPFSTTSGSNLGGQYAYVHSKITGVTLVQSWSKLRAVGSGSLSRLQDHGTVASIVGIHVGDILQTPRRPRPEIWLESSHLERDKLLGLSCAIAEHSPAITKTSRSHSLEAVRRSNRLRSRRYR